MELVIAMAAVAATWVVLAVLLTGLGLWLGATSPRWHSDRLFTAFWLGYLVAIAVLQVWHLLAPVGAPCLLILAALSAGGLARRGHGLAAWLGRSARTDRAFTIAAAVLLVWLANRALGPPVGDAGLYHLTVVRWFASHRIVPGLANLHDRLGFNNPSLLWSALIEVGPWRERSSHVANGVLVLALGLRGLLGISRTVVGPGPRRPLDLFAACLLPVAVAQAVSLFELRPSSPDPDAAAGLVALAAATELAALLSRDARIEAPRRLFAAASLAVLASALKVSMAPFSIAIVAIAFASEAMREGGLRPIRPPLVAWAAAMLVLVLPWLARGVILTGYPLFPLHVAPLDVDWRVPQRDVAALAQLVREHFMPPVAQQMRGSGESWLRPWLVWQVTRIPELVLLPGALCGMALLSIRGPAPAAVRPLRWLVLASCVAVAVWLATAPHPRFAYAFFWAAAAAALTIAFHGDEPLVAAGRRAPVVLLVAMPLVPVMHRVAAFAWLGDGRRAVESLFLTAGVDHGFHPTPVASTRPRATRSGVVVNVAEEAGGPTWDAPLPCTPSYRPDLALRRNPDLRSGFTIAR